VNKVQMDIRDGHQVTIDTVLAWVDDSAAISGKTVCDLGCGVGSLAIPLAKRGAKVRTRSPPKVEVRFSPT
jgi:magnesium-protoporphyrin O-methyltransferase